MRARAWTGLAAILLVGAGIQAASAAQLDNPEWPCIQPRVPALSVGQMWPGPMPPEDAAEDPAMKALARTLAPRRVSVEDIAAAALTAMQEVAPEARPEWLAELFAVILGRINVERDEVMAGIGRYAKHQQALAEQIDSLESDLATLEAVPEADKNMDRIEELQDELLWERRVFKERAQSLTYVCETPVLLEKRAFAIGRALSGLM